MLLIPVLALTLTEFAGVTHLFRDRDASPDHPNVAPRPVAKEDPSKKEDLPKKAEPPKEQRGLDRWLQRIAAMPIAEQIEEMRKELMRRNPGFDGNLGHTIARGRRSGSPKLLAHDTTAKDADHPPNRGLTHPFRALVGIRQTV